MQRFLDHWQRDVGRAWRILMRGVEPAYHAIDPSLSTRRNELVFPGRKGVPPTGARPDTHLFRALDRITPMRVRVVVLGQDPYPRVSRATGRAFEQGDLEDWTSGDPAVAASLRRILQEAAHFRTRRSAYRKAGGWRRLVRDVQIGDPEFAKPRLLFDSWQRQGVLFLNTGLTLTRYQMGGHPHQLKGHIPLWAPVVGAISLRLAEREDIPLVFLSWGGKARSFLASTGILRSKRRPPQVSEDFQSTAVVDRSHPAVHKFFGSRNLFDEANEKLESFGADPISW